MMVLSKLENLLVIPKALNDGASIHIAPGERVEIREVTPALENAEEKGLIKIFSTS